MSTDIITAYLALGSNLGDRESHLRAALAALTATPGITVTAASPFLQTAPVGGPPGQSDYLNGVARIETALSARALLTRCLEIERARGRQRSERWGPRTLDLDVLLYGDRVIAEDGLTVPHPRLRERWFVLAPLAQVAPASLPLPPDGRTLRDVMDALRRVETPAPRRSS